MPRRIMAGSRKSSNFMSVVWFDARIGKLPPLYVGSLNYSLNTLDILFLD